MFKNKHFLMNEAGEGEGSGTDLQAELDATREALRKANAEAAERRKALADMRSQYEGIDAEEYRKLKESQMTSEEKEAQKRAEWNKLIKEAEEKAKQYATKYEYAMVDERLTAAFASAKAIDAADCVSLTRGRCGIDEDGVFVKGDDGLPMTVDGKRISFADFAKDYLSKKPHLAQAGAAGAGSVGGKPSGAGKVITRAEFNAMSQQARIDASKDIRAGKLQIIDK